MLECKICGRESPEGQFMDKFGICNGCGMILDSDVKSLKNAIAIYQDAANSANAPKEKIMYLKLMLDALYEYKVKYYDNGVDVLDQNVEDLIDTVIDCISEAKL